MKSLDELNQLKEALENYEKRYSPFDVVNNNSEILNHEIDLHGGLKKLEATDLFNDNYKNIIKGLQNGTIVPNHGDGKTHVIKVICGYGHHAVDVKNPLFVGILRKAFLSFFTNSGLDFAYIEKHGCFLIRENLSA